MATLAVAHRSDDRAEELRACAERLQAELGARVVLVENKFVPYSSTSVQYAGLLAARRTMSSPEVLESIRSEGLYGVGADFRRLPFERLQTVSLALHNPKRVPHVIGCSQTAERLALQYGANPVDAKRAGILHDVTKALTGTEQLKLCESYGIILNHFEQNHPKLLHAKTGATIARAVFGENDAVYRAIYWHTTGTTGMPRSTRSSIWPIIWSRTGTSRALTSCARWSRSRLTRGCSAACGCPLSSSARARQ